MVQPAWQLPERQTLPLQQSVLNWHVEPWGWQCLHKPWSQMLEQHWAASVQVVSSPWQARHEPP